MISFLEILSKTYEVGSASQSTATAHLDSNFSSSSTLNMDFEVAEEKKLFVCGGNVGIHQTNTLFSSVHELEQLCLLPCGN